MLDAVSHMMSVFELILEQILGLFVIFLFFLLSGVTIFLYRPLRQLNLDLICLVRCVLNFLHLFHVDLNLHPNKQIDTITNKIESLLTAL